MDRECTDFYFTILNGNEKFNISKEIILKNIEIEKENEEWITVTPRKKKKKRTNLTIKSAKF